MITSPRRCVTISSLRAHHCRKPRNAARNGSRTHLSLRHEAALCRDSIYSRFHQFIACYCARRRLPITPPLEFIVATSAQRLAFETDRRGQVSRPISLTGLAFRPCRPSRCRQLARAMNAPAGSGLKTPQMRAIDRHRRCLRRARHAALSPRRAPATLSSRRGALILLRLKHTAAGREPRLASARPIAAAAPISESPFRRGDSRYHFESRELCRKAPSRLQENTVSRARRVRSEMPHD